MGIEGSSSNNEVQNQEINQSTNEQIEQNQAEHQRSGEELEGNSTIDNEGERKQIEGKDDARDGTDEAVIDPMEKGEYSYKHVFGGDEWRK